MTKCFYCQVDFPLLHVLLDSQDSQEGYTSCGKCAKRKPGMCAPEIAALNNKPQCAGCGLTTHALRLPLCNGCVVNYKKTDASIPMFILKLPGMRSILLADDSHDDSLAQPEEGPGSHGSSLEDTTFSNNALEILHSAAQHQGKASDTRLSTKPSARENGEFNLKNFKNLKKGHSIVEERKAKKEEAKLLDAGIRVSAMLWSLDDIGKMKPVNPIRVTQVYSAGEKTKHALNSLLAKVRIHFQERFPQANALNWTNITLYAHESQNKHSSLKHFNLELPMQKFFAEFVDQKLINETMRKERKIEIRFVFDHDSVFPDDIFDDTGLKSLRTSALVSKKKKAATTPSQPGPASAVPIAIFSKRREPEVKSSQLLKSSFLPLLSQATDLRPMARGPPVLKSAFRISPANSEQWSRSCTTVKSAFIRMKAKYSFADGLHVTFNTMSDVPEIIETATKFMSAQDEGYIGEGFTKRGTYARFNGREYVVTQPIDSHMSSDAVETLLKAEYALLCMGSRFKTEFDNYAQERGITTIPEFYFNFEDSIFGKFVPSLTSGSRNLPHSYFIATPLLPCSAVDAPVKKFTGNDSIGDAHDHLTKAVHAFAHFSVIYSHSNILFCDLQGALDKKGVLTLIDPQAHTATKVNNNCTEYWDGGRKKIDEFLEQHSAACKTNWICRSLGLDDTIVQLKSPEKDERTKRRQENEPLAATRKKTKLSYLLQKSGDGN